MKITSSPTIVTSGATVILVDFNVKGLDAGCEGQLLELKTRLRVTTDDAGMGGTCLLGGSCTTQDVIVGEGCLIDNGRCRNPTGADGIGINYGNTSIEILECWVERAGVRTFSCGVYTEITPP